ncbi:MAG TPA: zinc-binding dehydrogenase [Gammaproteobacteria bacterium]|nr:zinc-binding dehydrogenase [Gammaproteobacteria bacterium]
MRSYWVVQGERGLTLELRNVAQPEPKEGQLLVKVQASSFNRGELLTGHGAYDPKGKAAGIECAGEIARLGSGVTRFELGERVMGRCVGGFADYSVMDAREAMRIPQRLSWEQAAAIPLSFMVAHDMLVTHGNLQRGEWLLITGVSSGVGVASLLAGKALGANVIGTSGSAQKLDRLRELGLDVGVATRSGGFHADVMTATGNKGVDLVVNNVGGTVFAECVRSLAYQGRLATVGYLDRTLKAEIDLEALHARRLHLFGVSNKLRPAAERAVTVRAFERDFVPLFADGRLTPVVDRVFSLDDVSAAHAYFESNAMVGKVVVRR